MEHLEHGVLTTGTLWSSWCLFKLTRTLNAKVCFALVSWSDGEHGVSQEQLEELGKVTVIALLLVL